MNNSREGILRNKRNSTTSINNENGKVSKKYIQEEIEEVINFSNTLVNLKAAVHEGLSGSFTGGE